MTEQKKPRLKIKLGTFTTEFAALAPWPKLNKPGEKFNNYEAGIYVEGARLDELAEMFSAYRDKAVEQFKRDFPKKARLIKAGRLPLTEETDKDGNPTGKTILKATAKAGGTRKDGSAWSFKPVIKNAAGEQVRNPPLIYGGSTARLACTVFGYIGNTDATVGVKLELDGVQIKKLVTGGSMHGDTSSLTAVDEADEDDWVSGDAADGSDPTDEADSGGDF